MSRSGRAAILAMAVIRRILSVPVLHVGLYQLNLQLRALSRELLEQFVLLPELDR